MMVSRLVLSLKKSADPRSVAEWRVDHFTRVEVTDVSKMNFAMLPVRNPMVETAVSCESFHLLMPGLAGRQERLV